MRRRGRGVGVLYYEPPAWTRRREEIGKENEGGKRKGGGERGEGGRKKKKEVEQGII